MTGSSAAAVSLKLPEADFPDDERLTRLAFRRLILGESISSFGAQLSLIAVPTYAVIHLGASPAAISAINIVQWVPPLVLGLAAGRAADRFDRRWTMVVADILAAAASLWLGWLMWTRSLELAHIYLIVLVIAACGTFYSLGSAALVPRLLATESRARGNSHLAAAQSASHGAAQLISARIIEVAAGALVVMLDALSFLIRAVLVAGIRREVAQVATCEREPVDRTGSAWAVVVENPALVRLIGAQGSYNIGASFILAFFYIYVVRVLALEPFHIAVMLALGHVAGFAGAMALPRLVKDRELGAISAAALCASTTALWLIVAAAWLPAFAALLCYQAIFAAASVVFSVGVTTQRQNLTPLRHQGSVASFALLFGYACLIVGAALAAIASAALEVRTGIIAGCLLSSATLLWFVVPSAAAALARWRERAG